jgi:hypothetical protein
MAQRKRRFSDLGSAFAQPDEPRGRYGALSVWRGISSSRAAAPV